MIMGVVEALVMGIGLALVVNWGQRHFGRLPH